MKAKIKFAILVFIILSSIFYLNTTKSRYVAEANIQDSLSIAMPRIMLDTPVVTINSMLPGDTYTYTFNVQNTEDSKINEVLMEYYIKLNIIENNLPLTYKIYKINETQETELTASTNGYGPITLQYDTQEIQQFKIVFTWSENDNSSEYANKTYSFNLELECLQVI